MKDRTADAMWTGLCVGLALSHLPADSIYSTIGIVCSSVGAAFYANRWLGR